MAGGMEKLVPWESWHLWNGVREAIFSSSPASVSAALDKIAAWRTRSSLPVAVEVTGDLLRIQRIDPFFSTGSSAEGIVTDEMLCLMYSMAIMRLINGVVDHSKKQNTSSVAVRAEAAGLPRILVDIRHEVAHQELPSLSYLRLASKQALEWLNVHYWEAQKQLLDNVQKGLQAKLHACAFLSKTSENKAMSPMQARQKLMMHRAKKLVALSSPAVDLFGDSTGDKADLDTTTLSSTAIPANMDHIICNDELMDAEFQKSDHALSRAKKRMRSFYKSTHTVHFPTSYRDNDEAINTMDTDMDTPAKTAKRHSKDKFSCKGAWRIANDWKPCAIGMLPSKFHSAGVLPEFASSFGGFLAREDSTCQAEEAGVLGKEASSALVEMEDATTEALALVKVDDADIQNGPLGENRPGTENETREGSQERVKEDMKGCQSAKKQERKVDLKGPTGALIKEDGPFLHEKMKASLSGGFLLLNGIYQKCSLNQLADMRSSIRILK